MDAVVMCGGRGSRLSGRIEKPLIEVGGRPMLARVVRACEARGIDQVHAATSRHTPATREWVCEHEIGLIETPGVGYVEDLAAVIGELEPPFLTVTADIPGVAPRHIQRLLCSHRASRRAVTAVTSTHMKRWLGCSVAARYGDADLIPVGLNIVGPDPDEVVHMFDPAVSINVNTWTDLQIARTRCA
jgi:GTP:adenosylcobinamide-phosphate guanylyltransferase